MENIYTHKSPFFALFQFKMLGYILIIIGLINAVIDSYNYAFIAVAGIIFASLSDGIQIDFEKQLSRNYLSLLWFFKFGKWNNMHDSKHVVVFNQNLSQGMNMVSITSNNTSKNFKILVVGDNDTHTDAGTFKDKDAALKNGKQIADKLGVDFEDQTT